MGTKKKLTLVILLFLVLVAILVIVYTLKEIAFKNTSVVSQVETSSPSLQKSAIPEIPLSILAMRSRKYPGSTLKIEQNLSGGSNYKQYIASYLSDGLKINGLLTIPNGEKPAGGWPVIIFNHGYIQPEVYKTTERYIAYVDGFARNGYIVFKPDYRGNGQSQGQPEGAYYSPAYATDVLNAVSTLKQYKDANPDKVGMWGHSMGGNITLRAIVVNTKDIKAAVIWGGVVGTYNDLMNNWQRKVPFIPSQRELALRNSYRKNLTDKYGTPTDNPTFWNSLDPNSFISDITIPVQLHAGLADEEVPVAFSQGLYDRLKNAGKTVELFTYPGADHNIAGPSFNIAEQRSIEFFNMYLK